MGDSGEMALDDLLPIFLQEAQEQLEVLDQGLVRLEKEPDDVALIQGIFRAAHTLKGSAGTMGFRAVADFTHHLEDVLDAIRNHTLAVTPTVMDRLLQGLDVLHVLLGAVEGGAEGDAAQQAEVSAALAALLHAETPAGAAPPGVLDADTPLANLPPTQTALLVHFRDDCQMPAIRAFMIVQRIQACATLIHCLPNQDAIDQEQVDRRLLLVVESDASVDDLRALIMSVGEVDWVRAGRGSAGNGLYLNIPSREELQQQAAVTKPDEPAVHAAAQQTIRVNIDTLDAIMNIVGEIVLDRTRIASLTDELRGMALSHDFMREIEQVSQHLGAMVSDLHEEVLETRMLPVSQLFNRFPRLVRDLSRKLGKEINLVIDGEHERLDRSIIEKLVDPLTHLLRNAIDHGMELPEARVAAGKLPEGTILLSAARSENYVHIEIRDDGPGIDLERVKAKAVERQLISPEQAAKMPAQEALGLIFASGLSTSQQVSDVSGRGVGMDVVKRNVEALGGAIDIQSELGAGTTLTLKIPLTLAIVRALIIRVGTVAMAIPLTFIEETMRVRPEQVHTVEGHGLLRWRDRVVPVVRLAELFPGCGGGEVGDWQQLVAVCYNTQTVCLVVDGVVGHQEIVVKPLGAYLGDLPGLAGTTILGNGHVALIIDVGNLFERGLHRLARGATLPTPVA
jgi:two-component system chemotaxis sensor kinase CheA